MSKYPRTYHYKSSKGATNDDKIASNVNALLNREVVITEKLDGSNTAMVKGGVYGRSHIDYTKNSWDLKSWEIWNRINRDLNTEFIFGEGMYGIHSINYSRLDSYFYIFGIRDNDIWLPWSEVEEYSYLLDIPTVPVLFKGVINSEKELENIVNELVKKESTLGDEREGIVIRNASSFQNDDFKDNVQKWVRENHVTTGQHWQRNWKKAILYK